MIIEQILFAAAFAGGIYFFIKNIQKIVRNIQLGKKTDYPGPSSERLKNMLLVAFGQKKMFKKPIPALLHLFVYIGFVIINLEMLEIVIDGLFGTHRVFAHVLPAALYNLLIGSFEILAFLVIVACILFLARRYMLKLARFHKPEMKGWPTKDATIILCFEIVLMTLFLTMNAADQLLQQRGIEHYIQAGAFPVSSVISPLINSFSDFVLIITERAGCWLHIIGVLIFMNYLVISKHFHIIIAFPNTYYARLSPKAQLSSPEYVTNEVKAILDPSAAVSEPYTGRFGVKDITDLTRKQLMDAYSCTECGRCTEACPANQTGKKLSPRKIMMDVRDRMEEVGNNLDKHGASFIDNKTLLNDYITEEELWACTTCQACVEECPVNIDPLSIIVDLRRNLVMEDSKMPNELVGMNTNIENNGAPWQFSPADRFNWANGLNIPTMADKVAAGESVDVLFWVGCSGAFDDRYKSVTRSFAQILQSAHVSFAVLGLEETCTGDPAKRSGNEFLAQMQAMTNIQTLNGYGVKRIVTACPHCFNTLKNEYPALGGNYEVMHHSAFLAKLIDEGKLKVNESSTLQGQAITYHDSCYIGRGNGIYEAPRKVIEAFKADLREMKKCRTKGMCCGAGGAQVFKEEEAGTSRVNIERTQQALETGAGVIAAACPFCIIMMEDGVKQKNKDSEVKVKDLAELIVEANGLKV
jgi:Fe-S oxidoreductase